LAKNTQRGAKGRSPIPFIFADYARADEIQVRAQEFFLCVVHDATPAPLYSLRDKVLPKYREAFEFEAGRGRTEVDTKKYACEALVDVTLGDEMEGLNALPEFQAIRASAPLLYEATDELVSWSKQFNLRGRHPAAGESADSDSVKSARQAAMWPVIAALETVVEWHFGPASWLRSATNPPWWRPPLSLFKGFPKEIETLPAIKLRAPVCVFPRSNAPGADVGVDQAAWYVGLEPEKQFRTRAQACFELWLDQYIGAKKVLAREAGLVEVPGKRALDHFYWAANYQIEGKYMSTIAKQHNVSEEAAEDAVDNVLDLINLAKRPGRRGRQRRQKPRSSK